MSRADVHRLLANAIATGTTPGAVVAWSQDGRAPSVVVAGATATHAVPPVPVTEATVYDIASLTKPMATVAIAMRLVARGAISLDDPLSRWLPALAGETTRAITVRQVLGHGGGFAAHVEFFRRLRAGDLAGQASAREAIRAMAAAEPLAYPPGSTTIYSDLGYILLGFALEAATGSNLVALLAEHLVGPLGLTATRYVDLTEPLRPNASAWAATEHDDARGGIVLGEVHDENAHAAGGVLGHAGLFSTVGDVARFGQAIVDAWAGDDGVFDPTVVNQFVSERAAPVTSWRLGWDTPSSTPGVSHAGDAWSRQGIGHLGFTGCSLWLDRHRRRVAVILSNRVHPDRVTSTAGIKVLRREVMDAIVATMEQQ